MTTTPQGLCAVTSQNTPVDTAYEKGWAELRNGNLLDNAERENYEIMITADQSMRYQQNLEHRRIAIIVLLSNKWPRILSKAILNEKQ